MTQLFFSTVLKSFLTNWVCFPQTQDRMPVSEKPPKEWKELFHCDDYCCEGIDRTTLKIKKEARESTTNLTSGPWIFDVVPPQHYINLRFLISRFIYEFLPPVSFLLLFWFEAIFKVFSWGASRNIIFNNFISIFMSYQKEADVET